MIGNDTAAKQNVQVYILLLNCMDLSPQQEISWPAGPNRVGPVRVGAAFEEKG
jgi:hypothetical protein